MVCTRKENLLAAKAGHRSLHREVIEGSALYVILLFGNSLSEELNILIDTWRRHVMATAPQKIGDKAGIETMDPVVEAMQGNGQLPGSEVGGVDKIRALLFGNQMQDYDRRFSKLEERFHQRFKQVESDTARNLSAFESNAKKQIESVANQLREGKDVRSDA